MDPFVSLFMLCMAMLLASFLAGNIPLSFHLSSERLKLISNFGIGLLVGTALVVIIPEGIDTLYSVPSSPSAPVPERRADYGQESSPGSSYAKRFLSVESRLEEETVAKPRRILLQDEILLGQQEMDGESFGGHLDRTRLQDGTESTGSQDLSDQDQAESIRLARRGDGEAIDSDRAHHGLSSHEDEDQVDHREKELENSIYRPESYDYAGHGGQQQDSGRVPQSEPGKVHHQHEPEPQGGPGSEHDHQHQEGGRGETHKHVGRALLSGFILMFLIDQMGPTHAHAHDHSHDRQISIAEFSNLGSFRADGQDLDQEDHDSTKETSETTANNNTVHQRPQIHLRKHHQAKKKNNPITIGMVVHAAADGIALGASASRPELRLIVFLAIILHKAPSAFGLTTVLLQQGYGRRQAREQLAIFSLAAPIGAMLTFTFIQMSGQQEEAALQWWTGILLLFSGGTFLYVAMHVMSEMKNGHEHGHGADEILPLAVSGSGLDKKEWRLRELGEVGAVILGMVLPLLMAVDHGH